MNKEEILGSKPGRDLDIEVAVKVMDYIWLKHLFQFSAELAVKWLGTKTDLEQAGGVYVVVPDSQFVGLKERENFAEAVLNFSTEIGAAEQVIERMKELGYQYSLETKVEKGLNVYYVCFDKHGRQPDEPIVGFSTIPEAVSKAALTACLI